MKILITGAAGFIGFHLCKSLLEDGYEVMGIDNINDYYDINLKLSRLDQLNSYKNFSIEKIDISDPRYSTAIGLVKYAGQNFKNYNELNQNSFINQIKDSSYYEKVFKEKYIPSIKIIKKLNNILREKNNGIII